MSWSSGRRRTRISSTGASQLFSPFPDFVWLKNSRRRNEARNQIRRRYVKARIACAAGRIRHANVNAPGRFRISGFRFRIGNHSPRAENFVCVPLFNRNVEAAFQFPVNRRKRNGNVKRNPVSRGQNRLDRKSTRLNSSHLGISYAVFCLKKNKKNTSLMMYSIVSCLRSRQPPCTPTP